MAGSPRSSWRTSLGSVSRSPFRRALAIAESPGPLVVVAAAVSCMLIPGFVVNPPDLPPALWPLLVDWPGANNLQLSPVQIRHGPFCHRSRRNAMNPHSLGGLVDGGLETRDWGGRRPIRTRSAACPASMGRCVGAMGSGERAGNDGWKSLVPDCKLPRSTRRKPSGGVDVIPDAVRPPRAWGLRYALTGR
jgi:hypothetical protein